MKVDDDVAVREFKGFIIASEVYLTPYHHHFIPNLWRVFKLWTFPLSWHRERENVDTFSSADFIIFMTSFSCLICHAEPKNFWASLIYHTNIRHAYFHETSEWEGNGEKSIFATFALFHRNNLRLWITHLPLLELAHSVVCYPNFFLLSTKD